MTPSFIGLMATMLPGVRPSMSLASFPTASTRPFTLLMATIDGSLTTMPFPRAYTQVLAVPRSMARSLENNDSIERRLKGLLQEPANNRQLRVDKTWRKTVNSCEPLTMNCQLISPSYRQVRLQPECRSFRAP